MKSEVVSKLKGDLRGRVILPEDQNYDEARKVYNGMIDKHPKMIVKSADAADVRLAVAFARENDLLVAVRGGGHNGAGLATCDDGMVIDFTQMKGVRFNPSSSTIRAEAGCTQGDVNHLGQSFGVAVPAVLVLAPFWLIPTTLDVHLSMTLPILIPSRCPHPSGRNAHTDDQLAVGYLRGSPPSSSNAWAQPIRRSVAPTNSAR